MNDTFSRVPYTQYHAKHIPADALCVVTEKLNGIAGSYANTVVAVEPRWWQRLMWWKPNVFKYGHVNFDNWGDPTTELYRTMETRFITLRTGECLWFEIVGSYWHHTPAGNILVDIADEEELNGVQIRYAYGQVNGSAELFVYRITQTAVDGSEVELSWFEVQRRCNELNLKTVPQVSLALGAPTIDAKTLQGASALDRTHIKEGLVVRVESSQGTNWYNLENPQFTQAYVKDVE